MTEDEAKTKWCPQTLGHAPGKCIGANCMAWRARHQWLDNAQQSPRWVDYEPYAFTSGDGQERDAGYCGLAGKPDA